MRSVDDHDAAASQTGDDGHLPQRPAHVERPGKVVHDQLAQRGAVAGRREHLTADVRAQVEVRIVDPHRMRKVERHTMDLLAVSRYQVDALLDRLLDPLSAAAARDLRFALEHVHSAEVEGRLRPLGIQKPRITSGERLVKGLSAQALVAASSCALSSFFRIFPVAPLGRVSTNCTVRGYLYAARRSLTNSMMSSALAL